MSRSDKLVLGVGVNDASYKVTKREIVNGVSKQVWKCPVYRTWCGMLTRCYNTTYQEKYPSYSDSDCSVSPDWLVFSNFSRWMLCQEWEERHLDKDILVRGNRVYSDEFCVFVPREVNVFVNDCVATRGEFPQGVSWDKNCHRFVGYISVNGKQKHLGYFSSKEDAHNSWKAAKIILAESLIRRYNLSSRISEAILNRYK